MQIGYAMYDLWSSPRYDAYDASFLVAMRCAYALHIFSDRKQNKSDEAYIYNTCMNLT